MDKKACDTRIEPFTSALLDDTVGLLARAFVSNPLHVAAFGAHSMARNESFFRNGLAVMKGPKYVAFDGSHPIGFIHWTQSPTCQFSPAEKVRMVPAMIGGLGVHAAWLVTLWLSDWARYDPPEPHLHLGPIGVDPRAQGRGVGARLMAAFCDELERQSLPGYLETDRPGNVAFYSRFGFEVIAEKKVIGVTNYFMLRR
jgi:hypothetical protein